MFRYGASVCIDAVEISKMSTPANFGSVGRYALHWHLAGHPLSWRDYMLQNNAYGTYKTDYTRDARVQNSSNYCSFSRWVTIHGTNEVVVKNNVFFGAFGSGIFVEDGTELNSSIDHNLLVYNVLARPDVYINTIPLYANVSTDYSVPSLIWLKNSQTIVKRNVGCNSPITGIWYIPQYIGTLRGASTICVGDKNRSLPGIASAGAVLGFSVMGFLSETKNTYNDAAKYYLDNFGNDTACYAPAYFIDKGLVGKNTLCPLYTTSNDRNPLRLLAENVFYNVFTGLSTFNEAIDTPPAKYDGTGNCQSTVGKDSLKKLFKTAALYLPHDAQNAATDSQQVAIGTYIESTWAGTPLGKEGTGLYDDDFPFNPLSEEDVKTMSSDTFSVVTGANLVPMVVSGLLTFNVCAGSPLFGGSGWLKNSPVFLLDCCFLETSYRVSQSLASSDPNYQFWTTGAWQPQFSSAFPIGTGDYIKPYKNIFHTIHNLITNGGFAVPPNSTILSGSKTRFGDKSVAVEVEYNDKPKTKNPDRTGGHPACAHNYLYTTNGAPQINKLFPSTMFTNMYGDVDDTTITDLSTGEVFIGTKSGLVSKEKATITTNPKRRLPYMCDGKLLFMAGGQPVINYPTGAFETSKQIDLGNPICAALSLIPD